jgi:ABC-type transporter Mla subunit MlaD
VREWTPGSGVPAPWIGRGIAAAVKTSAQKPERENGEQSSAKLKALTKSVEELINSVDQLTDQADRLETLNDKLSEKMKTMSVLLDRTQSKSEESTSLARQALSQVAAAAADSDSLGKIFNQFIARVDAEMREKADSKIIEVFLPCLALSLSPAYFHTRALPLCERAMI